MVAARDLKENYKFSVKVIFIDLILREIFIHFVSGCEQPYIFSILR